MDAREKLLRWVHRFPGRFSKAEAVPREVDDALESMSGRLRRVDPETDTRWRLLRPAMERAERDVPAAGRARRFPAMRLALSAAVAVVVLLAGGIVAVKQFSPTIYETAKGRQSSVTLADGSEVVLNHSSELMVSHALFERSRRVSLRGEAFFRVQKDGTPFIVSTDVGAIRVLGTEFNVRVRDGSLEVAVLRGSVRVSVERDGRDSSVVVNKDQIVTCGRNTFPQEPGPLTFSSYPGWMHGKFMFYRTSLSSVCEEIEARFDVVIRIRDSRLRDETITGIVEGQSVDSALTALTRLAGTTYRNENGVYTLY